MVAENAEFIKKRIAEVCSRCGRNPEDVLVVGVSKTFGVDTIRDAINCGLLDIGENYVQELLAKRDELRDDRIRWHYIGHLQTNKVKYIAEFVHLIHSVDNMRVAEEIAARGKKAGRSIDVLVEVHTTDEATKTGVPLPGVLDLIKRISLLEHIRVQGLMTMGPFSEDPGDSRESFRQLKELREKVDKEGIEKVSMRHLSMGMSHDFEVAVEEDATIVRIGTALFGARGKAV